MQKILVVEDESVIRTALRRLLERSNYSIGEAASVQEAETQYTLTDFDLIISDLRLPGAPGTDLIKKAGAVPVLIMTSYASLRSAVDSMRMGAVDYIAKPFDHNDMVTAVHRIISEHPHDHAGSADDKQTASAVSAAAEGFVGSCTDMITLSNNRAKYDSTAARRVHRALIQAVRSGRIPESRIREANERILRLKARLAPLAAAKPREEKP